MVLFTTTAVRTSNPTITENLKSKDLCSVWRTNKTHKFIFYTSSHVIPGDTYMCITYQDDILVSLQNKASLLATALIKIKEKLAQTAVKYPCYTPDILDNLTGK
jgi:hypothetical protein